MRVMRKRRTYLQSFREDAIALVHRSDRPMDQIADGLGVPRSTLHYWYDVDMRKKGKGRGAAKLPVGDPAAESPEEKVARLEKHVAALEKENEALKLDRAILKKAAAFFAKESE
jgi:transposase